MKGLKTSLWIAALVGVAFLFVRAFRPTPVLVDVAKVERGRLIVTADDDGRTRVMERYTISAPIQGRLLRSPLDPGDVVEAGKIIVAEFDPIPPSLLDARTRAEVESRLKAVEAALLEARARQRQAEAARKLADAELARVKGLQESGDSSAARLERAQRDATHAASGASAAEFAAQVAEYEVNVVRASLRDPTSADVARKRADPNVEHVEAMADTRRLRLRSPIDGRVLRVYEESARALPAGTPILEIGNTRALEIVADYLSQDAVKIEPGMRVIIGGWGGEDEQGRELTLRGIVRVIEPGGYTKTSALGVEEQRVNIVVDPVGDEAVWAKFGDGFRVELRVVLLEQADVLLVPTGALFRSGKDWSVYVVRDERVELRRIRVGRRNGLEARVLEGLEVGDSVVMYPSELISDGARVETR